MTDTPTLLVIEHLTVRYAQQVIVDDVSFQLKKGQTLGIAGASGSGKTTLALAIPGLLSGKAHITGKVLFNGQLIDYQDYSVMKSIRGSQIGFIFQEPKSSLNPVLTCGEQIEETIRFHQQCSPQNARSQTFDWLKKVRIEDTERAYRAYPHELSGGQLQRVMIAIALCCNPSLIIADEPTTALDATVQKSLLDLLIDLRKEMEVSMIFVSHDMQVLRYVSNEIMLMENGQLSAMPIQNNIESNKNTIPTPNNTVVYHNESLSVHYNLPSSFWQRQQKQFTALDRVPITIWNGECLGIIGESGSGKSTLGRAVAQALGNATGGAVIIDQHPQSALNPMMPVGDAVLEIINLYQPGISRTEAREKTIAALGAVALESNFYQRLPRELSGGQKQRVCIARALAASPRILICDEIISALDPQNQEAILELLAHLKKSGIAILFISHDLKAVQALCDRVMVLYQGKLIEAGNTLEILTQPAHNYTKTLIGAYL